MSTTNAKHTPGPWEISDSDPDGGIYIEHNDARQGTFTIAHMHPAFSVERTPEAFAADCELIVQAPTMASRIAELEAALAAVTAQRDQCREAVEQLISQLEPVAVDVHEVAAIEDARAALRACDDKGGAL